MRYENKREREVMKNEKKKNTDGDPRSKFRATGYCELTFDGSFAEMFEESTGTKLGENGPLMVFDGTGQGRSYPLILEGSRDHGQAIMHVIVAEQLVDEADRKASACRDELSRVEKILDEARERFTS